MLLYYSPVSNGSTIALNSAIYLAFSWILNDRLYWWICKIMLLLCYYTVATFYNKKKPITACKRNKPVEHKFQQISVSWKSRHKSYCCFVKNWKHTWRQCCYITVTFGTIHHIKLKMPENAVTNREAQAVVCQRTCRTCNSQLWAFGSSDALACLGSSFVVLNSRLMLLD